MFKKVIVLSMFLLLLVGCTKKINQNDNVNRMYLSDIYYNKGEFVGIKSNDLLDKVNDTYVMFTYNSYCNLPISCEDIFKEFMNTYKIDFLYIPFDEFKNTKFYKIVKYAPSVMIIKNNEIVAYLNSNSDEDLEKYQDVNAFSKWMDKYIYFSKK